MARPPLEIDDPTPLNGTRIDLAARTGWLLRTWRIEADLPLHALSDHLDDAAGSRSTTALSRAEVQGERNSRRFDSYERALGLPYGWLRVPLDVVYRTYDHRPGDVAPLEPVDDVAAFTRICTAVTEPTAPTGPTGAAWLRFAEAHAAGPFGLPADLIRPLIEQLAGEVGRAVGHGYRQRYDALARLRCSRYAPVVLDAVGTMVLQPGARRLDDLVSALCEQPTVDLLDWCAALLTHPSELVARAACLGLQNLRSAGGLGADAWAAVAPQFAAGAAAAQGDPQRGLILATTIAACPPSLRAGLADAVRATLPTPPQPQRWTRNRLNRHYTAATDLATAIAGERYGEALLARLLFEILYDFRASHAVTAGFLLGASVFAPDVVRAVGDLARKPPDAMTLHGATSALGSLMMPTDDIDPGDLLDSDDPDRARAGLRIAAYAGRAPEPATILRWAREPAVRKDALFAAGMGCSPALGQLADDPDLPALVRARARGWAETGGRIVEHLDQADPAPPGQRS